MLLAKNQLCSILTCRSRLILSENSRLELSRYCIYAKFSPFIRQFLYRHTVRRFLISAKSDETTHNDVFSTIAIDNPVLEYLGASHQTPGFIARNLFPAGSAHQTRSGGKSARRQTTIYIGAKETIWGGYNTIALLAKSM